ncbi:uncharacterized protein LOC119666774 [Teleopsis dalmanni]|uniref:uncharacterized protein LOC119666774 n=1 Tax=Teleopsis dalmanni TaxID=139649 RepID=UPI0018CEC9F7|nr:uncharacterized protein LOC119666774 [Teleopsis dalmanni]
MIQKMFINIFILVLMCLSTCLSAPTETNETVEVVTTSDKQVELEQKNDESQLSEIAVQNIEDNIDSSSGKSNSGFKLTLLPEPPKTAESVNLEYEGIPSKILSKYDQSQKKLLDITNAVPILDTINEHDKYGNNGDMFDGISRSLVNGYEAFSNLLNTLIQKPKELARSLTKGITAQLDIIGGKIVGLQ